MRVAVFADTHGNPYATRAVLEAIREAGSFDAVVAAGDICTGGSDPAACVDLLKAAGVLALVGNADQGIFAPTAEPPADAYRARWDLTVRISAWAGERLGPERVEWLRELPFSLRFSPTLKGNDDLLVVHANPKDLYTHIAPPEEIQRALFGEVRQADDDPTLRDLLTGVGAAVMAHGHFHFTSERTLFGMRLVNVSPCSYSQFDTDRRARFTVLTWDGGWKVERYYADYDYHQEGKALLASDMPGKERTARFFLP